jgi:L-lactate dehydrogenase complex protein LldG
MTSSGADSRTEILARLRRVLDDSRPLFRGESGILEPDIPTPVTSGDGDRLALAELFGAKLTAVAGSYEIVEHTAEVPARILQRIEEWTSVDHDPAAERDATLTQVLSWAPDELPVAGIDRYLDDAGISLVVPDDLHDESSRERAASSAVGLTGVDAAFAGTGSVVLGAAPGKSRAASLLPLYHLMLVPMRTIYPTLEAWLQVLRRDGRLEEYLRQSAQIVFVTGPSKSADIELNLTLGVHGPRVVHAIVFDDS